MITILLKKSQTTEQVHFMVDSVEEKDTPQFTTNELFFPWQEEPDQFGHYAHEGLISPNSFMHIAGMFDLGAEVLNDA